MMVRLAEIIILRVKITIPILKITFLRLKASIRQTKMIIPGEKSAFAAEIVLIRH